jgi:Holliday junction DNA helicase RuvA
MIGKLTGQYGGTTESGVALVEVGGVGYAVRAPFSFFSTMHEGDSVALFIYTAVREDAIDLYGFLNEEELRFFKQLMSVSGIGPKSAIAILNVADVSTLKRAVAGGDASMLTKVYGIGKKSAERIVVELRDKLAGESAARGEVVGTTGGTDVEVIEALMALGYSTQEARRAIKDIDPAIGGVHERIAAALKYVGSRTTL